YDPGIAVAVPAPGIGGADWIHDIRLQYLRQGLAPDAGCGKREGVDPDVVVFPDRAGGVPRAGGPPGSLRIGAVGPVRLTPERPFPVAGLAEHDIPGQEPVMGSREGIKQLRFSEVFRGARLVGRIEYLDRRYIERNGIHHAADEAAVDRQTDHGGEEALGHAVRHINARRVAPFRYDVPFADDEPGRFTPNAERAYPRVERLPAKAFCLCEFLVPGRLRFHFDGKTDRPGNGGRVETQGCRA